MAAHGNVSIATSWRTLDAARRPFCDRPDSTTARDFVFAPARSIPQRIVCRDAKAMRGGLNALNSWKAKTKSSSTRWRMFIAFRRKLDLIY